MTPTNLGFIIENKIIYFSRFIFSMYPFQNLFIVSCDGILQIFSKYILIKVICPSVTACANTTTISLKYHRFNFGSLGSA